MNRPLSPQERLALEKLAKGQRPLAGAPGGSPQVSPDPAPGNAGGDSKEPVATVTRPPAENASRENLPPTPEQLLLGIQQRLARLTSDELAAHLQVDVLVNAVEARTISHRHFLMSMPEEASLFRIEDPSVEGSLYIEASTPLAHLLLGYLLDGNGREDKVNEVPERPLSRVEEALLVGVFDRITRCLREAWQPIATVNFQLVELEKHQRDPEKSEDHLLTRIEFQLSIGCHRGSFSISIPDSIIAALLPEEVLAAKKREDSPGPTGRENNLGILSATTVEVAAVLTTVPVSLLDLLELKPGDVIQTERHNDDPLLLEIEGTAAFTGAARKRGERLIFEIEGALNCEPDAPESEPSQAEDAPDQF